MATPSQVWLVLSELPDGSATSVGIDLEEALRLDKKGFAKLYRGTVYGASRREANKWADTQIKVRQDALGAA